MKIHSVVNRVTEKLLGDGRFPKSFSGRHGFSPRETEHRKLASKSAGMGTTPTTSTGTELTSDGRGLTDSLLRGSVGLPALALAAALISTHPVVALGLVSIALIALRGCPMCWTMRLTTAIAAKLRARR